MIRRTQAGVAGSLPATLFAALMWALPAAAADQRAGSLTIAQPWARATPPGATVGAAYLEISNAGRADRLLRIECPIAREAEVHMERMEGGLMQMRPVPSVDVPAHGHVVFEPEGLHVMLIDLRQPLREGQRFPLTLVFQHSGSVRVQVLVQGLGAMTAPPKGSDPHDHHH